MVDPYRPVPDAPGCSECGGHDSPLVFECQGCKARTCGDTCRRKHFADALYVGGKRIRCVFMGARMVTP